MFRIPLGNPQSDNAKPSILPRRFMEAIGLTSSPFKLVRDSPLYKARTKRIVSRIDASRFLSS